MIVSQNVLFNVAESSALDSHCGYLLHSGCSHILYGVCTESAASCEEFLD